MIYRLIFVEGVSGVGKTTTASLLRDTLREKGSLFTCHLEGDCSNPLDPFSGSYPPAMPLGAFTQAYADCWRGFMESQLGQDPRLILDGTLLHHQINDLIRNYDATDDAIAAHMTAILQILQPLNPIVFYLTSGDVGQRLRRARESRGQSPAAKEQIEYWTNRKRVDLFVLDKLPIQSQIIDIDGGWDMAVKTITDRII